MATKIPATQLAERIQQLLDDRQKHTDALAHIDLMLAGVGAALTGTPVPPKAEAEAEAPAGKGKKRRRRSKYATSAEESITAFIKENKNPTTQEIKKHYFSEGRGGSADNVLSKLFREKRVKRTPLGEGIRGSRYSLI